MEIQEMKKNIIQFNYELKYKDEGEDLILKAIDKLQLKDFKDIKINKSSISEDFFLRFMPRFIIKFKNSSFIFRKTSIDLMMQPIPFKIGKNGLREVDKKISIEEIIEIENLFNFLIVGIYANLKKEIFSKVIITLGLVLDKEILMKNIIVKEFLTKVSEKYKDINISHITIDFKNLNNKYSISFNQNKDKLYIIGEINQDKIDLTRTFHTLIEETIVKITEILKLF